MRRTARTIHRAIQWLLLVFCVLSATGTYFSARDMSRLLERGQTTTATLEDFRHTRQRAPGQDPFYLVNAAFKRVNGEPRSHTGMLISKGTYQSLKAAGTASTQQDILYLDDLPGIAPVLVADRAFAEGLARFQYSSAAVLLGLGLAVFAVMRWLERRFMAEEAAR